MVVRIPRPPSDKPRKAPAAPPDGAAGPITPPPHRFQPGVASNPKGRPPGPNKVTIEAREAASEIVDNPAYRAKLLDRALRGKLPPPVEALLWHYSKGVPKQVLDVNQRTIDASKMDTETLRAELSDLLSKL